MTLGEKLKQARLDAGLSQRQLCGEAITRNMLSQIENGSARPSMDTLQYLAARLGKTVSYFLEEQAVVSPNVALLERARGQYAAGEWTACLKTLEDYKGPDGVFEDEFTLLKNLALLELTQQAVLEGRLPYARNLLEQIGRNTLYYPALQRRHRLLLAKAGLETVLPSLDEELLLYAAVALEKEDFDRCADLLQAVQDKENTQWALLKGEALFGKGEYRQAADFYQKAEESVPEKVYPRLESCYRELGDYKLAYEYACKQR